MNANVAYLSANVVFGAQGLEFPWWPKPIEDLAVSSQSNGFHLQEMPALIVFMEGADDMEQKEVCAFLKTAGISTCHGMVMFSFVSSVPPYIPSHPELARVIVIKSPSVVVLAHVERTFFALFKVFTNVHIAYRG